MGPPLSLEVIVGATDVTFTWSLPQVTLRNGEITGFTLSCFSGGALMLRRSFSAPGTYKVSGFSSATAYNCSVVAVNSKGDGPPATLALRTQTAPTGDSEFATNEGCTTSIFKHSATVSIYYILLKGKTFSTNFFRFKSLVM